VSTESYNFFDVTTRGGLPTILNPDGVHLTLIGHERRFALLPYPRLVPVPIWRAELDAEHPMTVMWPDGVCARMMPVMSKTDGGSVPFTVQWLFATLAWSYYLLAYLMHDSGYQGADGGGPEGGLWVREPCHSEYHFRACRRDEIDELLRQLVLVHPDQFGADGQRSAHRSQAQRELDSARIFATVSWFSGGPWKNWRKIGSKTQGNAG